MGIILAAGISSKLVERLAPRLVAGPGLLLRSLGMLWLSAPAMESSDAVHVMPALFLTSFGLGTAAVVTTLTAVHGVAENQASVASALVNMAQQIGAALGLAVFTILAVSAANRQMPDAPGALLEGIARGDAAVTMSAAKALTYGYTMAFLVGAGLLLLAAIIAVVAVTTRHRQGAAVPGAGA